MIKAVTNKNMLNSFIYFIRDLYKNHPYYVLPLFSSLKKELKREVLEKKKYTALLCFHDHKLVGRIMYTIDYNKQLNENIGFFSFFDCYNDFKIVDELFSYMEKDLKSKGIRYIEGTYCPYDPDTRRGILAEGFDERPMLFNSYNYQYYNNLLLDYGFFKAYDTVSIKNDLAAVDYDKLSKYQSHFIQKYDIKIENLSWLHLNRDMNDIKQIFDVATNDINYQLPPSIKVIRSFVKQFSLFINKELIKICRDNRTNKPLGFCLILPDYNQIFQRTKGRILPLTLIRKKKHITSARGMLQYVIPEYQSTGLIAAIFCDIYETFLQLGIKQFEGGTIMEENYKSIQVLTKFNGVINKRYRIYRKEIV